MKKPRFSQDSSAGSGLSRRAVLNTLAALPLSGALEPAAAAVLKARQRPRPHIAVVGAGAFGGWTALHLLRSGAQVTLLDTWGPGNSRASSGGDTRVIRCLYGPDRIYVELVKRAFELWRESEKHWNTRFFHPTGALWMFSGDDSYATASLPAATELGFNVEALSPAEAARRFPQVRFDGIGSVFYEHEAGYLTARRACRAVLEGFLAEGGSFRQVQARPGKRAGGSLPGLKLSDGSDLEADQYVFACGPWLGHVFPEAVGELIQPTRQEIYYFGTPAGDTRFSEGTMPTWVELGQTLFYGIPGNESRGFKVADDSRGPLFDPTSGDRTPSAEGVSAARRFVARRFPDLGDAPLLEARVCQYENSPDGNYIVDRHPGADNVWLLGGGSGHGFKLGPALGEYVARRVLGEAAVDEFFSLGRLKGGSTSRTQFDSD